MESNKLLVIMPVYNTGKYLQGAIESVLQQNNVDLDLCIINDASTDNSSQIISHYSDRDNVIVFENEENRGTYYCRNLGLDLLSSGDYEFFTVHDSDDLSDINRYSILLHNFNNSHSVMGLSNSYMRIEEHKMNSHNFDGIIRKVGEGISIYRYKIFESIGYYDNSRFGADSEYLLRAKEYCNLNKLMIGHVDKIMYYARLRKSSLNKLVLSDKRSAYMKKIKSQIEMMKKSGDFYRNKFE